MLLLHIITKRVQCSMFVPFEHTQQGFCSKLLNSNICDSPAFLKMSFTRENKFIFGVFEILTFFFFPFFFARQAAAAMPEARATTALATFAEAGPETAAMEESEAAPGTWCATAVGKNT